MLEVVGLLAAGQFALKLLFAEEREQTLTEIRWGGARQGRVGWGGVAGE